MTEHWTLRAVGWHLLAATAATIAEWTLRLNVWAQSRSDRSRTLDTPTEEDW